MKVELFVERENLFCELSSLFFFTPMHLFDIGSAAPSSSLERREREKKIERENERKESERKEKKRKRVKEER